MRQTDLLMCATYSFTHVNLTEKSATFLEFILDKTARPADGAFGYCSGLIVNELVFPLLHHLGVDVNNEF